MSQVPDRGGTVTRALMLMVALTGSVCANSQAQVMYSVSDPQVYHAGKSRVQDMKPHVDLRAVGLDGSQRQPSGLGWAIGANAFENTAGNSKLGDVWLQTGTYSTTDVDISLPAPGFRWVVGRTYNNRQTHSATRYDSNGYQGRNWSQLSQPEIVLYDTTGDSNDMVYLVIGADRFIEFKWSSNSVDTGGQRVSEFRAINGAAGVIQLDTDKNDSNSTADTWTYFDGIGNKTIFFGFDTGGSGNARGQIWKMIDPAGNTAYVGDSSTAATAISNGYDGSGRILYAYDSADRRYTYTYTTIDSVARLTQVKAETKTGGTWASSPTGVAEVAKVDYAYYTGSSGYGDDGCLKMVTLTTPLTDSGVSDVRKKVYHYYVGSYDGTTNPGYPYGIKLVLDYEGARRYDWGVDTNLDEDFLTADADTLKSYSRAFLQYEESVHKVKKAFFNGECGCSGATNGAYELSYTSVEDIFSYSGSHVHRTVVKRPDTTYQTRYFDYVGQPLSSVITAGNPASSPGNTWATEVVRDGTGVITATYTPEAIDSYTHSTDTFTRESAVGLISIANRVSSGDLTAFLDADQAKDAGTGATATYIRSTKYLSSNPSFTVGSYTLTRPLLEKSRQFKVAATNESTASDYDETVTSYTYWSATSTDPLKIRPKTITTTFPKVANTNNGPGTGGGDPSVVTTRYVRQDGTPAFTLEHSFSDASNSDKVYHYTEYTNGQLTKRIADATTNGSFSSGNDPNTDFGITETGDGRNIVTTYTYDAQGRPDTTTLPDGRVTKNYYSKLADGRLVTISVPRMVAGGSTTYYGPASYMVTNQAGKQEFSGSLAIATAGITTALTSWINESSTDPIGALDGTLKPLAGVSSSIYDITGTRLDASWMYFVVPTSGAGSAGTNYDETTYGYDVMGRRWRTKAPTGDISRVVHDELGRTMERYHGTNDRNFTDGESTGTDDMVKVEAIAYDVNSRVTSRTLFVEGSSTGQRVTTYSYDGRGRMIVQVNPQAPHTLMKYDNLGRVITVSQYSSSSGLDVGDDPTSLATNRVARTDMSYDELGRAFKSTRHLIDQSDGSSDATLVSSLLWYDAEGRVIKTRGEQLGKTVYDRLGRATNRFVLAKVNEADTSYTDADDVSGDTVLEESQAYYQDSTGLALMTVHIARHPNDTLTTGALDTDSDLSLVDVSELEGRAQVTSHFYDNLNRLTHTAVVGTNGGSNFDRDVHASTTRSTTNLVTSYSYNDDGTLKDVTDPKALVTRTTYDAAGRKTATIANYVNGTPSAADGDDDVHTRYEYANGLMVRMWVDLDGDNVKDSDDQVTTYIFGTTKGTPTESKLATGHLLRAVKYPDSSNSGTTNANINSDSSDVVSYAYNALGQQVLVKDQAGNIIQTDYDTAGRQTQRRATTINTGAGFDDYVQRIETTYLSRGMVDKVTQYNNPAVGSGTVRDEVQYGYDGWGNLTDFDQDVDSAMGSSGRAVFGIDYAYEVNDPSDGGRATIRRTSITLPGSVTVTNGYGSSGSIADTASRVAKLTQSAVDVAAYEYLGAGHVVTTTLGTSTNLVSTVVSSGGTTYPYLDEFNRITSSRWTKVADVYRVDLTYDENSNITLAQDYVHTWTNGHLFDVSYTMDGLNRLTRAHEGHWDTGLTPDAINTGSDTRDEQWNSLSQTGNWLRRALDLNGDASFSGTGELDDSGTFNTVNEWLTRDSDSNASVNYTFAHDDVGNMTDDGQAYKYVYDAFGRLVRVLDQGDELVAEYRYNGLGYRTGWHYDADLDVDVDGSDPWYWFTYDDRWRIVATYREDDDDPKERFTWHNAGPNGYGGSSYIDLVVLRDRHVTTEWVEETNEDGLSERNFYCQNWRGDVSVITDTDATPIEWIKYSAYGVPTSYSLADYDHDGDVDSADNTAYFLATGSSGPGWLDVDFDGDNATGLDDSTWSAAYTAASTGGRGVQSRAKTANRIGYAGYEWDPAARVNHVRFRTYRPDIGSWTRRDPAGYVLGANLFGYVGANPLHSVDPTGLASSSCGSNNCGGTSSTVPLGVLLCWAEGSYSKCVSCCQGQGFGTECIGFCFIAFPYTEPSPQPDATPEQRACETACNSDVGRDAYGIQTCANGKVVACLCTGTPLTPHPGLPSPGTGFRQQLNQCVALAETWIQSGGDCTNVPDGSPPRYPDPGQDQQGACSFMRLKCESLRQAKQCIDSIACPDKPRDTSEACKAYRALESQNVQRGIKSWCGRAAECDRRGI